VSAVALSAPNVAWLLGHRRSRRLAGSGVVAKSRYAGRPRLLLLAIGQDGVEQDEVWLDLFREVESLHAAVGRERRSGTSGMVPVTLAAGGDEQRA